MTAITAGNVIPACTGVILYKSGVSEDTEITLTSSESYSPVTNSMKPNLAAYSLTGSGTISSTTYYNYTLAAGPVFKHSTGNGTLAAGKAFLRTTVNATGGGSAPSLSLVFDDNNTTGINEAIRPNNNSGMSDKTFYNLSGQRVTNPTKGLYIVNGKKVVIK